MNFSVKHALGAELIDLFLCDPVHIHFATAAPALRL